MPVVQFNFSSAPPPKTKKLEGAVKYKRFIELYAQRYALEPALIAAVINTESHFNYRAQSPKGAKGLMQLMDFNSRKFNIDPFNPEQNIRVGSYMLARLIKKYNSVPLALAAYNAGEGAVKKYGGIPPYKETRLYIKKIMNLYRR